MKRNIGLVGLLVALLALLGAGALLTAQGAPVSVPLEQGSIFTWTTGNDTAPPGDWTDVSWGTTYTVTEAGIGYRVEVAPSDDYNFAYLKDLCSGVTKELLCTGEGGPEFCGWNSTYTETVSLDYKPSDFNVAWDGQYGSTYGVLILTPNMYLGYDTAGHITLAGGHTDGYYEAPKSSSTLSPNTTYRIVASRVGITTTVTVDGDVWVTGQGPYYQETTAGEIRLESHVFIFDPSNIFEIGPVAYSASSDPCVDAGGGNVTPTATPTLNGTQIAQTATAAAWLTGTPTPNGTQIAQTQTAAPTATRTPYGGIPTEPPAGTSAPAPTATRVPYVPFPTPGVPTAAPPTATPDPREPPRVIGVFPCQGATCQDWNLRSGCGDNDLWTEIGMSTADTGIAGYRLEVLDATNALVCQHTFAEDNRIIGIKTTFLDEMVDSANAPCLSWPTTGSILFYDAANNLIDTRAYGTCECGTGYQAESWTLPDGTWVCTTSGPGGGWPQEFVTPIIPTATATPYGWTPSPTPTPGTYTAAGTGGLGRARSFSAVTPFPGQIYEEFQPYWDELNIGVMATRVAYNAGNGVKTILTFLPFMGCWGACPDTPRVPVGVPTITYTAGVCGTEYAPDYGSAVFRQAYADSVAAVTAAFKDDPNVEGFIISTGSSGESVNVYNQQVSGIYCNNQVEFEKQVTCTAFTDFVKMAMDAWRAGAPNKTLILNSGLGACSTLPDWKSIQILMGYADTLGIMYKFSGLKTGAGDAWRYGEAAPYGRMQYAAQAPLGAAYEHYNAATWLATDARAGHLLETIYTAIGTGGRIFLLLSSWPPYMTAWAAEVATKTMGTTAATSEAAWVRFRDWEFGITGPASRQRSDWPGPYTHLATIVGNATPTQYCNSEVKAAADAAGSASVVCPYLLTAPGQESRNVLRYPANSSVGIDVADDWQYSYANTSDANYEVKVIYLDSGTDTFDIAWNSSSGVQTHTVTKANSNTWITETLAVDARLNNGLPTLGDFEIRTGTGVEYLNLFWVSFVSDIGGRSVGPVTMPPAEQALPVAGGLAVLAGAGTAAYLLGRKRRRDGP
jgi:hypothetical protein